MSSAKRISPAILPALKEALLQAFWYKNDLRAFLMSCVSERAIVAQLDWGVGVYKRNIIAQLVDSLAADQHRHFDDLLSILIATSEIKDPSYLKSVEDGDRKYAAAIAALESLRKQVEPYLKLRSDAERAAQRRERDRLQAEADRATKEQLESLKADFYKIVQLAPQARGYALEKFLIQLFAVFDIDAKGSFRTTGEQIDGAFTHEGTEYILEARWRDGLTPGDELDSFEGKVGRKLDNTLGLFISMNGFQDTAITLHSNRRSTLILMTGADLNAVVDGWIALPSLITRKRQHAARTGEILIEAYNMLSG
ncbi:hypothetical protein [Mycolicibacterium wolinskyi]|uniref:hypothetical protein n=1 Tax=Mycolicibacterium wolinskyi TaxID=59750 RepID=UPI0039179B48